MKISFKSSANIVDRCGCSRFTEINFGSFIVFDIHNRLARLLQTNRKIFADGTSQLLAVCNITMNAVSLNHNLSKISE